MKTPFLLLIAVLLISCQSTNARDSVRWAGVYSGTIPAASAPGINVRLTLNNNETFELQYQYIDRSDEIYTVGGTFRWDEKGNIIILDAEDYPVYYLVSENYITQLDMNRNRITGNLTENYVLRKE